ncbi:PE-PPE domain-containing protein [Mycobacterium sp. ITM-2016-00318]|uniref:PE-PPE domain-containing protein n=1 Tax=Mycobacterium sp. ITM-2016-00318 TaxID=2099693 RepID=UPI001304B1F4|nr:PE-PPE domain-containing protein [Mycobacterium sp. ITM-2016-00318]WNG91293.1 PE-PPE domain-containing protein [Mycobacterium sp. ITM-2016-00318]
MKKLALSMVIALLGAITAVVVTVTSTISTAAQLMVTTIVMHGTGEGLPPPIFVSEALENYIYPTNPWLPADPNADPLFTPEDAWPLTGLFTYTFGRSVRIGLRDLEDEVNDAETTEPIVIFGISQSAVISTEYKRKLARQYPGTDNPDAPDITFVLPGNLNRPNGGVMSRFRGLYIPILNFSFNGPTPTNTSFTTYDIAREYDGFADFPNFPLNLLATLNAVAGIIYIHSGYMTVGLDPDPSQYQQGPPHGDTTYYFIPTPHLPLLQPFRDLGFPEPLLALIEPVLKVIIDLGYDRDIPPWRPTRAGLFPLLNPFTVANDLVNAIGQGIDDALGLPVPPSPFSNSEPTINAAARTGAETDPVTALETQADSIEPIESEPPTQSIQPTGTQLQPDIDPVTATKPQTDTDPVIETSKPNDVNEPSKTKKRKAVHEATETRKPNRVDKPSEINTLKDVDQGIDGETDTDLKKAHPADTHDDASESAAG